MPDPYELPLIDELYKLYERDRGEIRHFVFALLAVALQITQMQEDRSLREVFKMMVSKHLGE